jgi:hypothetical protein
MVEEPYVNAPYPAGAAVNRPLLADIDHNMSDQEIIGKLQSTPDLMMALWGEGDLNTLRYVPLHHAASRGRQYLLEFILANRAYPELVNLMNDNYFTALRYAHRSNLPHIASILTSAGAIEELPNISITCPCGEEFIYTSDKQARFNAQSFQAPRHCGNCRAARKAQQQNNGGGGDRQGGYQQRGGYGGGYNNRQPQEGGGYGGGYGGGDRNNNVGGGYGGRGGFNNFNNGGNRGFGNRGFQPREDGSPNPGHYQNNHGGGGYGGGSPNGYQQRPPQQQQQHYQPQQQQQQQQPRGFGGNPVAGGNGYYGYNRGDMN